MKRGQDAGGSRLGVDHSQLIRFKGITSTCHENKEANERITPFFMPPYFPDKTFCSKNNKQGSRKLHYRVGEINIL